LGVWAVVFQRQKPLGRGAKRVGRCPVTSRKACREAAGASMARPPSSRSKERLVGHAQSSVTVRFAKKRSSALAKLGIGSLFLHFSALIYTFWLCPLVTELHAWPTRPACRPTGLASNPPWKREDRPGDPGCLSVTGIHAWSVVGWCTMRASSAGPRSCRALAPTCSARRCRMPGGIS